ncbi:uncharacterized protein LOC134812293 isoform X3 [Bolinopsis microptera]
MKCNEESLLLEYVYLIMEHCGTTLGTYVKNNRTAEKDVWLKDVVGVVVHDVACGLNYLNKCGIFHRDIKPGNVCIEKNGDIRRAKIVDFGLARRKPDNSGSITTPISTAAYRAPEHLLGPKYKNQNDIWALGCILGFVVSSKHLFANGDSILDNILKYLGKPPQVFFDRIQTELDTNPVKVDQFLFRKLKNLTIILKDSHFDHGRVIFKEFNEGLERDMARSAENLMNMMLKWDYKERITARGILDSKFISLVRSSRPELSKDIVDEEHCRTTSEELGVLERQVKKVVEDDSISREDKLKTVQNYLTSTITEKYGYVQEWADHYEYHIPDGDEIPIGQLVIE